MDASRTLRLVGLRPGEGRSVGLAVAMSFVVAAGLMIGQSGIEAIFFARFGVERLPQMYLVLGGTMFLLTLGFSALLARMGRGRACIVIPFAIAVLAGAGRAGLAADLSWVPQVLWVLQGAGYFLLGLAVWGLAGIVTDTRQAKRFFPLIGAGSVLGYVIGGLVTKPLASWIGTPNLLFVWIVTLLAAAALGGALLAGSGERRSGRRGGGRQPGPIEQLRVGLRYVRRSALLRWLALASILFSLLFFSLYLPFSRAATVRYPDPDELAGFFGLFFGLATGAAFLISLFGTNRLLARFGVPTVMLVLPVLYAVAFGVLTIGAGFVALAVFRFAQVAWLQGGASSSWEAVINTVPPERRDQTRAFLYGGPTQVGTVLAGVVALIGERALSPSALYGIGLASAALAIVAMLGARRAYPRELVQALREGRPSVFGAGPSPSAESFGLARSDASALDIAVTALGDDDPHVRRVAATVLGDLDDARTTEPLVAASADDDAGVRAAAIRSLANGGAEDTLPAILERSVDPDSDTRIAVIDAIGALGVQAEAASHAVGPLMHDRDATVRVRAAAALMRLQNDPYAEAIVAEAAGDADELLRASAFRAMRDLAAPGLAHVVHTGMRDAMLAVRVEAVRAVVTIDPTEAVDALLPLLDDDEPLVRAAAAEALGRLPLDGGRDATEQYAAATVAEAVDHHRLMRAIDGDDDDERLRLLRDSLEHRSDREALAGLHATALLGGSAEMAVALENLSTADGSQRANALEVIESVARKDLARPLLAMWDGAPSHIDREQALDRLRTDPDDWIRACAEFATHPRGGTMTTTITTLAPMERVLFLRKVPLFAALPPPDLRPIAAIAEEQAFEDGDAIAEQGEVGDEMHIIVSGEVAVIGRDRSGSDRVVAVRSTGDAVGEMAIISNEPRIADLVARGPVRTLMIDRRRFESILRERPDTALGVIRVLCERLAETPEPPQTGDGETDSTTASTG